MNLNFKKKIEPKFFNNSSFLYRFKSFESSFSKQIVDVATFASLYFFVIKFLFVEILHHYNFI